MRASMLTQYAKRRSTSGLIGISTDEKPLRPDSYNFTNGAVCESSVRHRRRSRGTEGASPPLADKGANGIKCLPHFADLVE